ncbi:MBL fold metallo-hydrolase [Aspergillus undulatus]|uniref:MBL fold metallo-hydrolase n=1 Tax=Aspergillus undulatus TaxID=1810928 RepID=UPI003CCD7462
MPVSASSPSLLSSSSSSSSSSSMPTALSPPNLNIPSSPSTVTVRVIDTTTTLHLNPPLFWTPEIPGLTGIEAPALCFLISNEALNRHVLFDLGVRRDWENLAPVTVDLINRTTRVTVKKGVAEILDENYDLQQQHHQQDGQNKDRLENGCAIRSTNIESIIWSHHHFDHTGDPSSFPSHTSLIVGPGVKDLCWPGYPTNITGSVLNSDMSGRKVNELNFHNNDACKIGRFDAVDYFGDGSFYLLDAPGHSVGHLCALARVTSASASTSEADSFVFMGGDAAHHAGLLRPSVYLPLPEQVELDLSHSNHMYTHESLRRIHPQGSTIEPFLKPARGMFPAYAEAEDTLRKIQELDAARNILVVLPHDRSVLGNVGLFPDRINEWMEEGVKERIRWLFLGDFVGSELL